MFVLLTGEEVHTARTTQLQLIQAATKPARSVKTRLPLPDAIADVIDTALAFEREVRWQTAEAMRNALTLLAPSAHFVSAPPAGYTDANRGELAVAPTLAGLPAQAHTLIMGSGGPPSEKRED